MIAKVLKKIRNIIALLLVIIVLTVIMKVFLFASFKIPTPSMEPAIMAGDFIIVNKLLMGPRVYENWGFLNGKKTKMKRIPGISKVKRNDVLVFDFPYVAPGKIRQGGSVFYLKRCVAIPGDTFQIENGIYKVKGVNEVLGHIERQRELSEKDDNSFNEDMQNIFPNDTMHYRWTMKNFGPIYVPGKGDKVDIDSMSVLLYKNLIEYETGKKVTIANGLVLLDGVIMNSYTFLQDHYFMAGDLIHDSQDSRYWGLLPDDLVVGQATVIWKSEDMRTKKFRWSRFLKNIK